MSKLRNEKARVVRDGNVITAGGVNSGIDFGLAVAAEIAGECGGSGFLDSGIS